MRNRLSSQKRSERRRRAREEAQALFDLVGEEVRESDRVGWLGASSETSPAAVHLALLARTGEHRYFAWR